MTEDRADDLGVDILREHPCRVGMPQIVKTHGREVTKGEKPTETVIEDAGGEFHQICADRATGKDLTMFRRDQELTLGMICLARRDDRAGAYDRSGAFDREDAAAIVPGRNDAEDFPAPHTVKAGKDDGGIKIRATVTSCIRKLGDLLRGYDRIAVLMDPRKIEHGVRVPCYVAAFEGVVEHFSGGSVAIDNRLVGQTFILQLVGDLIEVRDVKLIEGKISDDGEDMVIEVDTVPRYRRIPKPPRHIVLLEILCQLSDRHIHYRLFPM